MTTKKRNHKRAMARRNVRQESNEKNQKQKRQEYAFKLYQGDSPILPMPTLVDALSLQNFTEDKEISDAINSQIENFSASLERIKNEKDASSFYLPDNVVSFVIPLDFCIPAPSPYHAIIYNSLGDEVAYASCVTIVSKVIRIGNSAIKVSYLISAICENPASKSSKNRQHEQLLEALKKAVSSCNSIITSFQTLPERHHHYFHQITDRSIPGIVRTFTFSWKKRRILTKYDILPNHNAAAEILYSTPLKEEELQLFGRIHVSQSISDDKLFYLINKMDEAISSRCLGRIDECFLKIDAFVELAIGYLLCEAKIANGCKRDKVYEEYSEMSSASDIWGELASILDISVKKLKKSVGFYEWMKNCHQRRNQLTHRFLFDNYSGRESLDALFYSEELIRKLCEMIEEKYKNNSYPIVEKARFLKESTRIIKGLHEIDEIQKRSEAQQ